MRTIQRPIVSAILLSKDRKVFLGKKDRTKGGVYRDCWHIPGGSMKEGEEAIDTLMREILEETGIIFEQNQCVLFDDKGTGSSEKILENGERVLCEMTFIVYKVLLEKNRREIDVHLNNDLVKYMWLSIEELQTAQLTPPSIALFARAPLL